MDSKLKEAIERIDEDSSVKAIDKSLIRKCLIHANSALTKKEQVTAKLFIDTLDSAKIDKASKAKLIENKAKLLQIINKHIDLFKKDANDHDISDKDDLSDIIKKVDAYVSEYCGLSDNHPMRGCHTGMTSRNGQ
jgi:outer membrane PBP1 activator LpoA protein